MILNATIRTAATIKAKINTTNGIINPTSPITLKNQIQEQVFNSIEDLPDVSEVNVSNNATLVYNASNDLYEVKQLDLDGGEF
jgi:hypothetical protein